MVQVEKYMRVCLGVKDGLESVVTVAASEPILTEAAAAVMQYPFQHRFQHRFRSCQALRRILEWPGMSKGDRGELITSNITIDTLDRFMFRDHTIGSKSLIVPVTSYFKALFTQGIYDKKIWDSFPSMLGSDSHDKSFVEMFKDSHIYITHFIKVYDFKVLSVQFLSRLAAQGAGVICADNQCGIDMALPMLWKHPESGKVFVSVIMKQSKNNSNYSDNPVPFLFDNMNPFNLHIFDKSVEPPPVIRMVYPLASAWHLLSPM